MLSIDVGGVEREAQALHRKWVTLTFAFTFAFALTLALAFTFALTLAFTFTLTFTFTFTFTLAFTFTLTLTLALMRGGREAAAIQARVARDAAMGSVARFAIERSGEHAGCRCGHDEEHRERSRAHEPRIAPRSLAHPPNAPALRYKSA